MKTRTWLIIVLVTVLLAGYLSIGIDYLNQRNRGNSLDAQIVDASAALFQIPQPPEDLEARLAAAQGALEEAQNAFVIDLTSTEILNNILNAATLAGVKAVPLSTQPWADKDVADQTYTVFRVEVAATGTYPQLTVFFNKLESSSIGTMTIEWLTVSSPEGGSQLNSADKNTLEITANVMIAVYAVAADGGEG